MAPEPLPLLIFGVTYLCLALGRAPGLAIDRTGFALLGALAFLATGALSLEQAKEAVDAPTLAVLFAMMLLSAQYHLSGLYGAISRRLGRVGSPRRLLAGTLAVCALLAAVLTNDVVCFALTPLLLVSLRRTRLDPVPYLLAIAIGTNIGSALTPIGNPQNILIAQRLELDFLPFVAFCAPPVLLSLAAAYLLLARRLRPLGDAGARETAPPPEGPPLDRWQAAKAIGLTALAIALFLSPLPAHLTAAAVAGLVLTSRKMHTRSMLGLVDWQMLALFVGLFAVTRGFELSGWTAALAGSLQRAGLPLGEGAVLVPAVALLGTLVGNVPAVMLLLRFLPTEAEVGYALALASTLAGNAVLVGSVANLIVVEQAAREGVVIGFRAHLRVGLPIALLSLAIAAAALALS